MVMISKFNSTCVACGGRITTGEKIEWTRGVGARHFALEQCERAKTEKIARDAARAAAPKIDLKPIVEFLQRPLRSGLKRPKLRVLDVDGRSEIRLSVTTMGQAPGSVVVKRGYDFLGTVRPDGEVRGHLVQNEDLQRVLVRVAQDPMRAAKEYAVLMGFCCFCGKELTDDGSVDAGYGPICAKHWGLPHKALGVKTPVSVTR